MSRHLDARRLFGAEVRRHRRLAGLSQEALAEASELHRTYIGRIERGETNITLLNIIQIAAGLKLPPATLLAPFE